MQTRLNFSRNSNQRDLYVFSKILTKFIIFTLLYAFFLGSSIATLNVPPPIQLEVSHKALSFSFTEKSASTTLL